MDMSCEPNADIYFTNSPKPYGYLNFINSCCYLPAAVYLNGDFTVMTWLKVRSFGYYLRLFEFTGPSYVILILSEHYTDVTFFAMDAYNVRLQPSERISLGRWTHICVTLLGSYGKFYIDGRMVAQGSLRFANRIGLVKNSIGCATSNSDVKSLEGSLMEFKIFNRALGQNEINFEMNFLNLFN